MTKYEILRCSSTHGEQLSSIHLVRFTVTVAGAFSIYVDGTNRRFKEG